MNKDAIDENNLTVFHEEKETTVKVRAELELAA